MLPPADSNSRETVFEVPAMSDVNEYILPFPNPKSCVTAHVCILEGTLVWINRDDDSVLNPNMKSSGYIQRHTFIPVILLDRLVVPSNDYQNAFKSTQYYNSAGGHFRVKTLDGQIFSEMKKCRDSCTNSLFLHGDCAQLIPSFIQWIHLLVRKKLKLFSPTNKEKLC